MRRSLLTAILLTWTVVAVLQATTYVSDAFTDTSGTNLESHTPGTGGKWVKSAVYAGTAGINSSNQLIHETSGNGTLYYNDAAPASAEYVLEADMIHSGAADGDASMFLAARVHTTEETYYAAGWDGTNDVWTIFWAIAGTFDGGGTADTISASTKHLKFVVTNASKQLYVDGVLKHSTTNNSITAANFGGVTTFGDTDLNVILFDNFLMTDVPVSSTCGTFLLLKVGC